MHKNFIYSLYNIYFSIMTESRVNLIMPYLNCVLTMNGGVEYK